MRLCLKPPGDVGIKGDGRSGCTRRLDPLVPMRPVRQQDEVPRSLGGSRAGDQGSMGRSRFQYPRGSSRPVGPRREIPRFQGHAVASRPIRHEYPDILVEESPWYQAGRGTKVNEGAWDLGAACASTAEEPSPSRPLDRLSLGGSSRPIRHQRLGPSPPSAPWWSGDQGGRGTEVLYIRMAPWHPRGLQIAWRPGLLASRGIEHLGEPADRGPCHLRQLGAIGSLGTEATRDRFGPGTKVVDGWKCRVDEGPIKARDQGGR